MKLLMLLSFLTTGVSAEVIKLSAADQGKLGELVSKLPLSVRDRTTTRMTDGLFVKSVFPKTESPFKVNCQLSYYNNSDIPSTSRCLLEIDSHHPDTDMKYDEFKILVKDALVAKALFDKISFGKPFKELRSNGKIQGTNFEGKNSWIFDFFFKCSETECVLRTTKNVLPEAPLEHPEEQLNY